MLKAFLPCYYYYLKHVTTFVQVKNLFLWNITVLMAIKFATSPWLHLSTSTKDPIQCRAQSTLRLAESRRVHCSLIAIYLEQIITAPPSILA